MQSSFKAICGTLCGLIMICSYGANAYAADPCVIEVFLEKTKVYPVSKEDNTLQSLLKEGLPLKKGFDLGVIPKELLNQEGNALSKDFLFTLSVKFTLKEKTTLEVQAENGLRYLILEKTPFKVLSPKTAIPTGTKVIKQGGTTPDNYALDQDLNVNVTLPNNYQAVLEFDPQTRVKKIPEPGTSSMGTTLEVKPQRAPKGGYIKLFVEKKGFDINNALFHVCFRLPGDNKAFIASPDVELKGIKQEKAELTARIPEEIDGLGGVHFARLVDLLVVAQIPEYKGTKETKVRTAEVMTREFSISSRRLAVILWILAFVLPWFIAALIAVHMGGTQANQSRWQAWKAQLNPIWFVSGKYGGASLSLAQILLWSILVFSASFYVLVVSGKLLDLTNDVLVLLGIAGGTSVIAKITASAKEEKGEALAGAAMKEARWLDLIHTDGRPDLYKFQMALFTVLAVVFVTGKIFATLEFPELPAGLLTLIGISNGVYLVAKATSATPATSKPALEKLGEKEEELKKAEAAWKKTQEEATKLKEEADKETDAQKKEKAKKEWEVTYNLEKELRKKVEDLQAEIKKLKEEPSKKG